MKIRVDYRMSAYIEADTLEELFLQTRSINFRWIKQSLEEKAVNQLKELIK